jgi:hypothetical protein
MNISLDGLLDYEEEDREESTFEVSHLPCPGSPFASLFLPFVAASQNQLLVAAHFVAGVLFL